jgi:transcriptional regulator PpsR
VLLRLAQAAAGAASASPDLADALRLAPDAVAVTDEEGRVKGVNDAFLELAQLATREQAIGQSVDRWLGRSGVDVSVLLSNLRQRGMVRLFTTGLRGELGAMADVEISASRMDQGAVPAYAFFVRDVGLRVGSEHPLNVKMPKSIEQLTQRVGRVPLKELVRESTDIIEALCIEAALELTSDNRASAAELLGLSRQSLYAKLRRYRIGGLGGDGESAE